MSKDRSQIVWEKKEILKAIETMNDGKIDKFYGLMITKVLGDSRREDK